MSARKLVAILFVAIVSIGIVACKGSSSGGGGGHNAQGTNIIGGVGGQGRVGGPGGVLYLVAQNEINVKSGGNLNVPDITMPVGSRIIDADYTLTDNDILGADGGPGDDGVDDDGDTTVDECNEMGWAGTDDVIANGLKITHGTTVFIPDTLTCSASLRVSGPVVIAGQIELDPANVGAAGIEVDADEEIVVTGRIDVSGPDNAAGGGYLGATIDLENNNVLDSTAGIYIKGDLISNGGNATGAAGNGGPGGAIVIVTGDSADIEVDGDLSVAGGNGVEGVGNGGNAGVIQLINSTDDGTNLDEGSINLYDVRKMEFSGGIGELTGGPGQMVQLITDIGAIELGVPAFVEGGEATDAGGQGGMAGQFVAYTNMDSSETQISDMKITDNISAFGGSGSRGGNGSPMVVLYAINGNLYVDGIIDVSGGYGSSLTAGQGGGNGGMVTAYAIDVPPTVEDFSIAIRKVLLDGGDGGDRGGNAGVMQQINPTYGFIYVAPKSASAIGGEGVTTMGAIGTVVYTGYVKYVKNFPSYHSLP